MNCRDKCKFRLLHSNITKWSVVVILIAITIVCILYLNNNPKFSFPLLTIILSFGIFVVTRPRLKFGKAKKPNIEKNIKKISYKLKIQNMSFFPAKKCKLKITFSVNKDNIRNQDDAVIKDKDGYPDQGIDNDPILWDEYINKAEERSTTYHLNAFDSATAELFSCVFEKPSECIIRIASEIINKPRIVLVNKFDLEINIRLTGDNFYPLEETCKITNNNNGDDPVMSFLNGIGGISEKIRKWSH